MSLLSVEEALKSVLMFCEPRGTVRLPLEDAIGFALAQDAVAAVNLPAFDNSAVDGYAVRIADIAHGTEHSPAVLPVLLTQAAGSAPAVLPAGGCARVLTGGPVPQGADAVVMQEDTARQPNGAIAFLESPVPGQHVRPACTDIRIGEVVLTAGTTVGPAELAALAAAGCVDVEVVSKPTVAIVTTGDEVMDLCTALPLPPGAIYNSNAPLISALLCGIEVPFIKRVHLPDDFDATVSLFRELVEAGTDAVIIAGGVSVGDRDFVKPAIEAIGSLSLWRVALKPGKPLAFGNAGSTLFFGLPGNPASVLVTFELFVRPALWKLCGRTRLHRPIISGILQDAISHDVGRREYVRATLCTRAGRCEVTTTGAQGSGRLRSLIGANALVIIPEDSPGCGPGDVVQAMLLMGDSD